MPRSKSADPLYRFVKDGKAGYIDGTGRIVIAPRLATYGNYGSEFHDGRLEIGVVDGNYVDPTGNIVIDKGLSGSDFSEGLAAASRKDERLWGYIDTSGRFAIQPQFEDARSFSDGLAMIGAGGKVGYIDHSGRVVIKPQFLDGFDFSDGMARVIAEGPCFYIPDDPCGFFNPRTVGGNDRRPATPCGFTYIDKTGRVITQQRFEKAGECSEGLAPVLVGKLWGFIDKTGVLVIKPQFDSAGPFSSGLSVIRQHGLFGYVDRSGAIRIAPRYESADNFSEGFAVVGDGADRYWYIDPQGRHTIPGEFAVASQFFKGLAHVVLRRHDYPSEDEFAYIDTKGRLVFTYSGSK
jgi:hypothetical protein